MFFRLKTVIVFALLLCCSLNSFGGGKYNRYVAPVEAGVTAPALLKGILVRGPLKTKVTGSLSDGLKMNHGKMIIQCSSQQKWVHLKLLYHLSLKG